MVETYLLLGGNTGDREYYLKEAIKQIELLIGHVIKQSSIYETEPWGFESPNSFLNQALCVETNLAPNDIITKIQHIEQLLHRQRTVGGYESRTIDIDILFYGNSFINEENLVVPHPRLHERKFTLIPLDEINPKLIHPVFNKSIQQLLEECSDKSEVIKKPAYY
jgi:2-amino-4-hydroxy-6-hydroxymethyldihydropteridine diphosphokinase